ncbi:MAG: hypothetical protein A3F20_00395 [Candidatus Zambryskibacteria bacterium RIFCSPHIGHO2_12_FULL_39_21]|nr:MAG: hypothetical protein A3B88_02070 [Candidatus Zambryskibacteria bacterium RIFCSPHIGHO2_02_FULL_39_19]OHA98991.1 MAG: hypothetical protein A3F20_00395 [Candidatus Zambryskibacteria bacterium RIFCSPHIGHO2_12_FULL_39_21]
MPVVIKLKDSYKLWQVLLAILPKTLRYSMGIKIDSLFVEVIEYTSMASFLEKSEKLPYLKVAIRKIDTIKILLMIVWENRGIDDKKYITISESLNEVGKMLGGWSGQLIKSASVKTSA